MNDLADYHARCRAHLAEFSAAWARGDVDGLLAAMGDAPLYRSSSGPGPGAVFEGRAAVAAAFERMVAGNRGKPAGDGPPLEPPGTRWFGNQALVPWKLQLPGPDGQPREVEGVDVLTFDTSGRIAVKDAYRKAFA